MSPDAPGGEDWPAASLGDTAWRPGQRVRSVLVVGGGSAGWMTATVLKNQLGGELEVTLVESPEVPRIGVGEATVTSFRRTLALAGIGEREFLRRCDATFKLGIEFRGWRPDGRRFTHPFGQHFHPPEVLGRWMRLAAAQETDSFASHVDGGLWELARAGRGPKAGDEPDYASVVERDNPHRQRSYGYQLDATLFAGLLADHGRALGVRHVLDHVDDVALAPDGFVDGLATRQHGRLTADLYVDCTGFRRLLVGHHLAEPWEDYGEHLLNDRAVAIGVPTAADEPIPPFTVSHALAHGWAWITPLQSRLGTGYVYSSAFCAPEEAETELRRFLGPAAAHLPMAHIPMRVGCTRRVWVRNVVANGLAAGFVEPLESTGLATSEALAARLANRLCRGGPIGELVVAETNLTMTAVFEHIRDFITLHYVACRRRDTPYWREATSLERAPRSVAALLAAYDAGRPPITPLEERPPFRDSAWLYILAGLGRLPRATDPAVPTDVDEEHDRLQASQRAHRRALTSSLPPHRELLRRLTLPPSADPAPVGTGPTEGIGDDLTFVA